MSALCLKLLNLMQMATCEASTIALISKGETEVRRVMVTCTDQSVRWGKNRLCFSQVKILKRKKTEQKRENFTSTKALVGHLSLGAGLKAVLTPLEDGRWDNVW